jgi:hypothetical protein
MSDEKESDFKPPSAYETSLAVLALQINVRCLAADMLRIERQMQKLDAIYYHIFPDRLKQDVEFERQLDALKSRPRPDDKKIS